MEREPFEVADDIERGIKELAEICGKFKLASKVAAEAEVTYKVSFAKARIAARLSVVDRRMSNDEADDTATVQTEEEYRAHEVAKSIADAYKHKMVAVREANNNNQSLLRYLREQGA